jgi:hypothetical protein
VRWSSVFERKKAKPALQFRKRLVQVPPSGSVLLKVLPPPVL